MAAFVQLVASRARPLASSRPGLIWVPPNASAHGSLAQGGVKLLGVLGAVGVYQSITMLAGKRGARRSPKRMQVDYVAEAMIPEPPEVKRKTEKVKAKAARGNGLGQCCSRTG